MSDVPSLNLKEPLTSGEIVWEARPRPPAAWTWLLSALLTAFALGMVLQASDLSLVLGWLLFCGLAFLWPVLIIKVRAFYRLTVRADGTVHLSDARGLEPVRSASSDTSQIQRLEMTSTPAGTELRWWWEGDGEPTFLLRVPDERVEELVSRLRSAGAPI